MMVSARKAHDREQKEKVPTQRRVHQYRYPSYRPQPNARIVHPNLQSVISLVHDIPSLRQNLKQSREGASAGAGAGEGTDPLRNWVLQQDASSKDTAANNAASSEDHCFNVNDMKTWFPCDDRVAFYEPSTNKSDSSSSSNSYHHLTYRQLHRLIGEIPPFPMTMPRDTTATDAAAAAVAAKNNRVAIIIPAEQMACTATALLATIMSTPSAVAVPLDPRMPPFRILEAMEQLECNAMIVSDATESILLDVTTKNSNMTPPLLTWDTLMHTCRIHPFWLNNDNNNDGNTHLLEYFKTQVRQIRIIKAGDCGRMMDWHDLQRQTVATTPSNNSHDQISSDVAWVCKNNHDSDHNQNHTTPSQGSNIYTCSPNNNNDDIVMLLRTSGTTNKPKVVPISRSMLLYAGMSIASTLELQRDDCNCNAMPYYHIGGIACNLLAVLISGSSVLFAGPLKDPNDFLDHLTNANNNGVHVHDHHGSRSSSTSQSVPLPTWYYAGPSMHKAIVLLAEARAKQSGKPTVPNCLRFIRSASAHLNHDLALRLSRIFNCQVIPTYGMSEAMPICSSAPIDASRDPPCEVIDSVGFPVGTSVTIRDPETHAILEYGSVGEICVKGQGVISRYLHLNVKTTHTLDGWLLTGDRGMLDRQGRLFIKGRSKEMIKRGGEQVWPNEIDDIVEKIPGIATAVTFGVPNELWGEEIAIAVVLVNPNMIHHKEYLSSLEDTIMKTCSIELNTLSVPRQVKFLASTEDLPMGATGKYLRSKMAHHFNLKAVDMGALRMLESVGNIHPNPTTDPTTDQESSSFSWKWLNYVMEDGTRVKPSDALNGLRFLVACFVVHGHCGLFPNIGWIKLQMYQPNMIIFFILGAFQTTSSVAQSVKKQWAGFVGTKIGSLHGIFVISQFFTLPSYVLFHAYDEDGNWVWTASDWIRTLVFFAFDTFTGMGHGYGISGVTWFQSTYYIFLILFPFFDDYFRSKTIKVQASWFALFVTLAAALWGMLYVLVPTAVFWSFIYPLGWTLVSWLPLLLASMLAAYFFRWVVEYYFLKRSKESAEETRRESSSLSATEMDTRSIENIREYTKVWGIVCDVCSLSLLLIAAMVVSAPSCLCVHNETFQAMRPSMDLPEHQCLFTTGEKASQYVYACDITQSEFADYIQDDPYHDEKGRFPTIISGAFGYLRISAPLFLLWVFSMAFGNGFVVRFFSSRFMTALAPLGYAVYLLHNAIGRYYWALTRGIKKEFWFPITCEYPFPVEWWEALIILLSSVGLGYIVNTFLVPPIMPFFINLGVKTCHLVSSIIKDHFHLPSIDDDDDDENEAFSVPKAVVCGPSSSSTEQIEVMVRGLTGIEVTRSTKLQQLGLDSLGAAALLGMLRASVASAKALSLQQLQSCETVGCLSDLLDQSQFVPHSGVEGPFEGIDSSRKERTSSNSDDSSFTM